MGVVATAENVHFPCGVIDSIKHDVGVADDWHLVVRQPHTPALVAAWDGTALSDLSDIPLLYLQTLMQFVEHDAIQLLAY